MTSRKRSLSPRRRRRKEGSSTEEGEEIVGPSLTSIRDAIKTSPCGCGANGQGIEHRLITQKQLDDLARPLFILRVIDAVFSRPVLWFYGSLGMFGFSLSCYLMGFLTLLASFVWLRGVDAAKSAAATNALIALWNTTAPSLVIGAYIWVWVGVPFWIVFVLASMGGYALIRTIEWALNRWLGLTALLPNSADLRAFWGHTLRGVIISFIATFVLGAFTSVGARPAMTAAVATEAATASL